MERSARWTGAGWWVAECTGLRAGAGWRGGKAVAVRCRCDSISDRGDI